MHIFLLITFFVIFLMLLATYYYYYYWQRDYWLLLIIIVAYLHLGTRDSVCIFLQVGFSLANFSLTFRAEGIRIMPLSRVFFAGNGFHVEVVFFSTLL